MTLCVCVCVFYYKGKDTSPKQLHFLDALVDMVLMAGDWDTLKSSTLNEKLQRFAEREREREREREQT